MTAARAFAAASIGAVLLTVAPARPVQDCRRGYGTGLGLAEVTRLDREGFAQELHTVLRPCPEWPGRKLHTLNRAGHLEVIDGSGLSPRLPLPRRALSFV
jgi:hypothetical protein